MKYWKCTNKTFFLWTGLFFLEAVGNAQAQQSFSTTWSGYVGDTLSADGIYAVAADNQTNVFIGGVLGQGTICSDPQIYPLNDNNGGDNGFLAKLSAQGALLWFRDFGSEKDDRITSLAIQTNGTVFAAGVSQRTGTDDSGTDALLSSVRTDDGSENWTFTFGNANTSNGFNAVAVDANGFVYAAGYISYSNFANRVSGYSVSGTTYGNNYKGNTDGLVVKFSPAGEVLWSCYLGGTNADIATACAIGADGSLYVGGETRSPGWVSHSSRTPSPNNPDAFLVKLNTNGVHVWSTFLGGSAADSITALAKDPSASVLYVGGSTASSDFMPNGVRLNTHAGGTDGFAVKLLDTGSGFQTNWCRFFGGSTTDSVSSLALLTNGNLVVGGVTDAGSWLTQTVASSFGGVTDGFLSLLYTDGSVIWSSYVGGARSDELNALAITTNGILTVGNTFSSGWVSGGFWTTWSKVEDFPDVGDFGFVAKWSPEPGVSPAVTDDADDLTVNEGDSAIFSITATGSIPLRYQWFRNGALLSNATSNAYSIAAVVTTNNNDTYDCMVSNYFGTVTSRVARLTVVAKGTLCVTLSPSLAISQGAQWSITGGTNWVASGASTNLPPGFYTVTFTNLTGWTSPASLSNVRVYSGATTTTSGVYAAVLPSAVRSVTAWTNVTLTVYAPAGLSTWTLVENLPSGVTPAGIVGGGVWDGGARTLTFSGTDASTNTLSYSTVCTTSGVYTVSGTVTPQPANVPVAITGDSRIISATFIRIITGTNVVITVYQPLSNVTWTVNEYLPEALTPINITGPVTYSDVGEIDWKKKGLSTNLTYGVTGEPGHYTLSGQGQIGTGSDFEPIFGDSVLIIPDSNSNADVPLPTILSFVPASAGYYELTFTSTVSQTYSILTNASVANTNGWATCLSLSGQAGTTQQQVPMGGSNLFYRVRLQ